MDIQEAFTNVTCVTCEAVVRMNKKYKIYEIWKEELLVKMIKLVMRNNYVQTSVGYYKFKPVLPMGYKISGEALNVVVLACEIDRLGEVDDRRIGEILDYPSEITDISAMCEISMVDGVKLYRRYVDDIFGIVAGKTLDDLIKGILALGYMHHIGLVVNINVNVMTSRFLDVVIWRDFFKKIHTMMKQDSIAPFGHVKAASNHPKVYKLQSLKGEMLRNRRLASDDVIVRSFDESILE